MANNNNGHSSPSARLLWFIVPVAIVLSIHLTTHEHAMPRPYMSGDLTEARTTDTVKVDASAVQDTSKSDTSAVAHQDAPEMHTSPPAGNH